MNEAETSTEHIDLALKAAGWGLVEGSRIRREYPIVFFQDHRVDCLPLGEQKRDVKPSKPEINDSVAKPERASRRARLSPLIAARGAKQI